MQNAPVILFLYNRPNHTRKTLDALKKNQGAKDTDLIIYSDAARDDVDIAAVSEVRSIAKDTDGFQSVTIHERVTNWGLAKSIIRGVTEVIEDFGSAIILEDDIVTSPAFLTFMNNALNAYKTDRSVWHISGWNYPISATSLPDSFFWGVMNCWGWATWEDRWKYFKKDPETLFKTFSRKDIKKFNLDGLHNFWNQIQKNHSGKLDTWAVFWYATIFKNGGLCLNPTRSLTLNIGLDGSGSNCGTNSSPIPPRLFNDTTPPDLPSAVLENAEAEKTIKKHLKEIKPSLLKRISKRIKG